MYKIFIVEDDREIAEAIQAQAALWGLEAHCAENFRDITGEFSALQPHLVLLDIRLPFYDGYYWCSALRRISSVPILFISSASDNMNIIMAMNIGADDFIAKPFHGDVLIAKIQALLRRTYDYSEVMPVLAHRGALLNTGSGTFSFRGSEIALTKNEYRIMLTLMQNKGRTVSRELLMQRLWETESFIDDNTLTVNINRLRKKLLAAGLEDFILTKFGEGYCIPV